MREREKALIEALQEIARIMEHGTIFEMAAAAIKEVSKRPAKDKWDCPSCTTDDPDVECLDESNYSGEGWMKMRCDHCECHWTVDYETVVTDITITTSATCQSCGEVVPEQKHLSHSNLCPDCFTTKEV